MTRQTRSLVVVMARKGMGWEDIMIELRLPLYDKPEVRSLVMKFGGAEKKTRVGGSGSGDEVDANRPRDGLAAAALLGQM